MSYTKKTPRLKPTFLSPFYMRATKKCTFKDCVYKSLCRHLHRVHNPSLNAFRFFFLSHFLPERYTRVKKYFV